MAVYFSDITSRRYLAEERERLLLASEVAGADAQIVRERSDALLGSIADAFYLLDHDFRFTYLNDDALVVLQTTREALLGTTVWESFPQSVDSPVAVAFVDTLFTGGLNSVEAYFVSLATWFEVHSYSRSGGLMVHFRDINARKAGEVERERLLHTDCGGGRHSGECGGRDRSAAAGNVGGGDCGGGGAAGLVQMLSGRRE